MKKILNHRKIGVRCYDAGKGENNEDGPADRYTAVFTGHYRHLTAREQCYRAMSAYPCHPQGIGIWGSASRDIDRPSYKHLGKKISFDALPEQCQRLVMADAFDLAIDWE